MSLERGEQGYCHLQCGVYKHAEGTAVQREIFSCVGCLYCSYTYGFYIDNLISCLDLTQRRVLGLNNPRRACAARVAVVGLCVCVSVCLSVDDYSRTTGYEAAYKRYQQLQCYKGMKNNVAILLKRLRSRDMA